MAVLRALCAHAIVFMDKTQPLNGHWTPENGMSVLREVKIKPAAWQLIADIHAGFI